MRFLVLVLLAISFSAYSNTYSFKCIDSGSYQDSAIVRINSKTMTVYDNSRLWSEAGGVQVYNNHGMIQGNGQMRGRFEYYVDYEKSENRPYEGLDSVFISSSLPFGGYEFKNGKRGGYISFLGHMYSYETFICFEE